MVTKDTKAIFLFPGQGAQYPGMALDLLATGSAGVRELFALASEALGADAEKALAESSAETLKRSDLAQPLITLANLAAAAFLRERGLEPAACAGHSLGEYAALACAGMLGAGDCLRLVTLRGRAMQEASERLGAGPDAPGMAAVLGLPPEEVEALLARWGIEGLYAANYNSPKQVVISGTAPALAAAELKFRESGARRVLRLQVSGPFHSPLMAEAAAAFAPAVEAAAFADPRIPCCSNVSGGVIGSGEEARRLALRQITEPVRWTAEEAALAALSGAEAALEAGPGSVLRGLWKDTGSAVPCYAAGTRAGIEALGN
ncbi:MAG: ACP S-malonyltransferase [Spirochaetaceae bacterium]|jgi:[acyl-carrier-protein] S-malonyltransferase|nr:ACP S-malonyltransferase [Spirochaetaceae bacterium]